MTFFGKCVKCGMLLCFDAARVGVVDHPVVRTRYATRPTKQQYLTLCASHKRMLETLQGVFAIKAKPFTMFHHDGIIAD